MNYMLGIDAGSSAVKTALFDTDGSMQAVSIQEYEFQTPSPNVVEIDAAVFWEKMKLGLGEVLARTGIAPGDIAALGISSQGETFVPMGKDGAPLRPAIFWLDGRATKQAEDIASAFTRENIFEVTGMPEIIPMWTAGKILWIKDNEPEVFSNAHKYLLVEDYLIFRLTGCHVGEFSLYPSTLFLDITRKRLWQEMLDFVGVREDQFVELKESGEPVGPITAEAARELGLSTGTIVATGGYDHAAGAIGSGNTRLGVVTETTGSALVVNSTVEQATFDPEMRVPCQYHAVKDRYFLSSFSETAGMAFKWFRDKFCREEIRLADEQGRSAFELIGEEAAQIPAGSEGVVMLPHLAGAFCPESNSDARGVFFGLALKHGRMHLARALMEAVAFMLKRHVEVVEQLGVDVKEIISIGGGAKSRLWRQIKADVLNKPVVTLEAEEPSLLGAAILAAVAVGIFDDLESASRQMVQVKERVEPDPANVKVYAQVFDLYVRIYEGLAGVFPKQEE